MSRHPYSAVPSTVQDIDRLIYEGDVAAVGSFRCPPSDPRFRDSGPIRNHCLVFPRTAVRIDMRRIGSVHADATVATVYRTGQEYVRRTIDAAGDHCDYFVIGADLAESAAPLFERPTVNTPSAVYLAQRAVFEHVVDPGPHGHDPLAIDEAIVAIVGAMADAARPTAALPLTAKHLEIAAHARFILAKNPAATIRLADLARMTDASVFHLCRIFRRATRRTIQEYRTELRLRASLDRLRDGVDVTTVAFEFGFSSHSHFTSVFRNRFGRVPRHWRIAPYRTTFRQSASVGK